jgi:hypothetical protein
MKKRWLSAFFLALPAVLAVGEKAPIVQWGVFSIKLAGAILAIATILILPLKKNMSESGKNVVFWTLSVLVMGSTVFFAGTIVTENLQSQTGGPVHWHADYQVHVCGERVDLIDPKGFSNKVGTPLFHEHDDDRIHVEGTVMDIPDVNLGNYFKVIGGKLANGTLTYPTENGTVTKEPGDTCNGEPASLQVYVNGDRIDNYEDYLYYPDPYVPPGDCIIIEFDSTPTETTDKICSSWEAQGWDYENYTRPEKTIGGVTWQ